MIAVICAQAWVPQANASNVGEGKVLYAQFRCADCHGDDGKKRPAENVAALAGMNTDLIYTKTKRFVETRAHDNVLAGCGAPPSTIEIKKISDYLATLPK
jgi:cytochrome c553